MSVFQHTITSDRLFRTLHIWVKKSQWFETALAEKAIAYFDAYAAANGLQAEDIGRIYNQYISQYNLDIEAFEATGKYPPLLDAERTPPSRVEYNVILLLSVLLAPHRFRIMQLVRDRAEVVENGLMIGCGPGLEIELIKEQVAKLVAYDLSIDPFTMQKHPEVDFREMLFDGQSGGEYQSVFLIELLEHLKDPYGLLKDCVSVLAPGGRIHLTTATHLPQWDHWYNFAADHVEFEARVKEMGLEIEFVEEIRHAYLVKDLGSLNRYYVLRNR